MDDKNTQRAQKVLHYAEMIEAEMRRLGWWRSEPPTPEQMKFTKAFAMDTMSFQQWLQFVFLPRVREAAARNQFPSSSSVAVVAVREFDGYPEVETLTRLLTEFDQLF